MEQKHVSFYVLLSLFTFLYSLTIEGAFATFYSLFLNQIRFSLPAESLAIVLYIGIYALAYDVLISLSFALIPIMEYFYSKRNSRDLRKDFNRYVIFYHFLMYTSVITTGFLTFYFGYLYHKNLGSTKYSSFFLYSISSCIGVKFLFYLTLLIIKCNYFRKNQESTSSCFCCMKKPLKV